MTMSKRCIPYTPRSRELKDTTFAIVTTAGVHLRDQEPFDLSGDNTWRIIPGDVQSQQLMVTHEHYDRRDAAHDLNLIFPLERLLELEVQGVVGHVAETHYGFGFTDNPHELLSPGHRIGTMLAQANVDLVLLVPA